MSKAATQSKLAQLHEMLAEVFIADLIQSKEEGIPLPAANLGVIRQFLKDNEITASIEEDDMLALRDAFADVRAADREARKAQLNKALDDDSMMHILQ